MRNLPSHPRPGGMAPHRSKRSFWDPKRCASEPSGLLSLRQKYDWNVPQPSGHHAPSTKTLRGVQLAQLAPTATCPAQTTPRWTHSWKAARGRSASAFPIWTKTSRSPCAAKYWAVHAPEQGIAQRDSPRLPRCCSGSQTPLSERVSRAAPTSPGHRRSPSTGQPRPTH